MAILKKLYILTLPLILSGCYEDFTPDVDVKPVLCLSSLVTAGEPISVIVTHTWLYSDPVEGAQDRCVEDATLTIYANGEETNADFIPKEGDEIRIVAESPTYGHAEAEVTVPKCVPIESLEWQANVIRIDEENYYGKEYINFTISLSAKLTLNDPADVTNYYQFVYSDFIGQNYEIPDDLYDDPVATFNSGTFHYQAEPIFSEHIGEMDAINGYDAYGFNFFTDRQFSGKSYTLNLQFPEMHYNKSKNSFTDEWLNCGLIFTLGNVSQSFYNINSYLWNLNYGSIGDLSNVGLSEPMWGYSNVSTKAGAVCARTCAQYKINLRDVLKEAINTALQN